MIVSMPDGKKVRFPDDMPREEIRSLILQKYPKAGQPQPVEQAQKPEESTLNKLEPILTMASGVVAEPVAGMAGIVEELFPSGERTSTQAIEQTRKALTYEPRTKEGQESLQTVGEVMRPVGEAITATEKALGDTAFKLTGSPAIATMAGTLPTVVMEGLGFKGGGKTAARTAKATPSQKSIEKSLRQNAPTPETLRSFADDIYKELDESGIQLKKGSVKSLANKVDASLKKGAFDDVSSQQTFARLQAIKNDAEGSIPITRLDSHRQRIAEIARSGSGNDKAAAKTALDAIESFQDDLKPVQLTGRSIPADQINKRYKTARNFYARSKKSETVQNAIKEAQKSASGFENGLRVEFRKITNQKGKSKFFNKDELAIMDDLIAGDTTQNFAKLIGRFGFSEGRATNIIGGSLGLAAGGSVGGPVGAAVASAAAGASRKLAGKLTGDKAALIQASIAGGKNSQEIVKAYLTAVPKKLRKADELANLLSDPNIDLAPLLKSADKVVKEATEIAAGRQAIGEALGMAAATAAMQQQKLQAQEQRAQPSPDNEILQKINEQIRLRQGGL